MRKILIIPEGVCCDRILVEEQDGIIKTVEFDGGCDGNGKALGRLLEGQTIERAVTVLAGVNCEGKGTSCADQLSKGLIKQAL